MRVAVLTGLACLAASALATAADFSTWQKKIKVTFAGYNKAETLTNFPVLTVFSNGMASGFSYGDFLSNTNQDLRFAASDGVSELNYEIDRWNTNGTSWVWVQVPNIASTNDFIWAYWGKPSVTAPSYTTNGATWSNGYRIVYHFNDPSGNAQDSTANRNTATNVGSGVTFVTNGYVGNAALIDAENDTMLIPPVTNAAFTASLWYFYGDLGSDNGWNTIFVRDGGTYHHLLVQDSSRTIGFYNGSQTLSATVLATNAWYYLTVVVSGTSYKLYLNGDLPPIVNSAAGFFDNTLYNLNRISTYQGSQQAARGRLDEIRFDNAVRSTNWIWACYMTMASNRAFESYGVVQVGGMPLVANAGATNVLSTTADLVGNVTATGTSATAVSVYWDTTDRGTNRLWTYTNGPMTATALGVTTNAATGLSSNTTYWFTYYATNSMGESWATPSLSFKTPGLPAVDNDGGPSNVTPTTATLNGVLTAGVSAQVRVQWGLASGTLDNTNDFGTRSEGPFFTNIAGLTKGTAYSYRCYASNAYGEAWSAVTNFNTSGDLEILSSTNLVWTQSGLFTNDGVRVSGTGTVVTLQVHPIYGTLVEYYFKNLIVTNGATILCKGQTNGPLYDANGKGVSIISSGDVIVGTMSAISADGQGYANTRGPGVGGTGWPGQSGGGYGGVGGDGEVGEVGGTTYGSYAQPLCLGSGGGRYESMWHYAGGAIKITAAGKVQVDGMVTANSQPSPQNFTGAGSGGSIWITAGPTFSGSGVVCANGGTNVNQNYNVGGGGGGRVAVYATANAFSGTVSAYGGVRRYYSSPCGHGAAGTVFVKLASQSYGSLILDNSGLTNTWARGNGAARLATASDTGNYTFDNIVLKRAGYLEIVGTETVNVAQATVNCGTGDVTGKLTWTLGRGSLLLPSAYVVSNFTLALNNGTPEGLTDLVITNGAKLSHWANVSAELYRLNLNLTSLVVCAGSAVDASGKGYEAGYGPGRASGPANPGAGGAGHGGVGGDPFALPGAGGLTYGSALAPTNSGSGGVQAATGITPGGGAVKIVAGDVTVDGTITVDAPSSTKDAYFDTPGSAGSIWIKAANLYGGAAGRITANGASHGGDHYNTGGGGGGRIAIDVNANNFGGQILAYGGARGGPVAGNRSYYGSAGTIYTKTSTGANGDLIVDNNGITDTGSRGNSAAHLALANDAASYTFDNIILRNGGHLEIVGNETLNVTPTTINNGQGDPSGKLTWTMGKGTLSMPANYVVTNYTLALNNGTPASLTDLTLASGAKLTHSANATDETYRLDLALSSFTVNAGAVVDATRKGYSSAQGPGKGYLIAQNDDGTGASHGGVSGRPRAPGGREDVTSPPTYGSLSQPTNMGSGGGGWTTPGGGAVKIVTTGEIAMNGTVTADGTSSTTGYNNDSPGSGGSIWLQCSRLSGTTAAAITARGGTHGADYYDTGGAGGGRIAIYTPDNGYSGLILADGGLGRSSSFAGGNGTILIKRPTQTYGTLVINATNVVETPSAARLSASNDVATWAFDELVLTNRGRLEVVSGQTLDLSGAVVQGGGGTLVNNGTVNLPANHTITNYTLEINQGALLKGVQFLTVASGGVITHTLNSSNETYRMDFSVPNLTIQAGGQVSADRKGFNSSYGPGAANALYKGSSYGGVGLNYSAGPYGSATAPTNLGSGGFLWSDQKRAGGAIKLTVRKTLVVDGTITARGETNATLYGSAASGGSIWLDVGRLSGSGSIRADGLANNQGWNGGSGGGRIAIGYAKGGLPNMPAFGLYTNRETISTNITVKGGYNIGADGPEDGSIYIYQAVRPAEGSLFTLY